ncbi:hypothetical protein JCM19236_589 [Vibrio sp. JCM 19236]|nr:hypothetical protein JCM19236_589 [Vibrio sp. JCM 19236]
MLELGAKELIQSLDKLMYDFDLEKISGFIDHNFAPNAKIQLAHPFETLSNPQALAYEVYQPLLEAVPDLEKRNLYLDGWRGSWRLLGGCGWLLYWKLSRALVRYSTNRSSDVDALSRVLSH